MSKPKYLRTIKGVIRSDFRLHDQQMTIRAREWWCRSSGHPSHPPELSIPIDYWGEDGILYTRLFVSPIYELVQGKIVGSASLPNRTLQGSEYGFVIEWEVLAPVHLVGYKEVVMIGHNDDLAGLANFDALEKKLVYQVYTLDFTDQFVETGQNCFYPYLAPHPLVIFIGGQRTINLGTLELRCAAQYHDRD